MFFPQKNLPSLSLGVVFFASFLTSCGTQQEANSVYLKNKEISMVALGDSISTGVFADTKVADFPWKYLRDILGLGASNPLQVLKDSDAWLKRMENSINKKSYRTHLTAFGTTQAWGIRQHLAKKNGLGKAIQVKYQSFAEFGKRASDLVDQVNQAAKANKKPSIITILIGANDFCGGMEPQKFGQELSKSLTHLRKQFPTTSVYIGNLPPIAKLPLNKAVDNHIYIQADVPTGEVPIRKSKVDLPFKITVEYPEFIIKKRRLEVSCKTIRMKFCPVMYQANAQNLVDSFNTTIEQAAQDFNATFVDGLENLKTNKNSFGFDCFHPSEASQKDIAAAFIKKIKAA